MLIEFRPATFPKLQSKKYRYIVIHDINCMYKENSLGSVSEGTNAIFTVPKMRNLNFIFNKQFDFNYHYVCEKRGRDYEVTIGRPLNRACEYTVEGQFRDSVHVGILMDLNVQNATSRLYRALSYKIIFPLMFFYGIPMGNVVMHRDIDMSRSLLKCPGHFFDEKILQTYLKGLMQK